MVVIVVPLATPGTKKQKRRRWLSIVSLPLALSLARSVSDFYTADFVEPDTSSLVLNSVRGWPTVWLTRATWKLRVVRSQSDAEIVISCAIFRH